MPGARTLVSAPERLCDRIAGWALTKPDESAFTALSYRGARRSARTVTYARLFGAACALAQRLRDDSAPGDRVAVLCEHGLDYVVAFLACLYSGRVAVPLPPVDGSRATERLDGVLADARPALGVISRGDVRTGSALGAAAGRILSPDLDAHAERPEPEAGDHDPAYLQYTSGSTRRPAGVRVTHANLAAALTQLYDAVPPTRERPIVTWLPFFHDMGLILGLSLPLYCGVHGVTLAPQDFAKRPIRWLRACDDYRAGTTASPDFGLALTVSATSPHERAGLDLSVLEAMLNGAEPIRAKVLTEFSRTFAEYGFRHRAHTPGFGLAEATLTVTVADHRAEPVTHHFDRQALGAGTAVPVAAGDANGIALVSCGFPAGQQVAVVDPNRRTELADGAVGEIWVSGPNVGDGYHGDPHSSANTFGAILDGRAERWLRTGDLGFLFRGELYIAGRRKDMIIIDGRNHYPSDIEATSAAATPYIRPGRLTAFGHDDGARECLVIVAELHASDLPESMPTDGIARHIRTAVAVAHQVMPFAVLLVEPGTIPKTSSGKIRRAETRTRYAAGRLPLIATAGRPSPG